MKLTKTVVVKHVVNVRMEKFAILLQSVIVENVPRAFVNVSNLLIHFLKRDLRIVIVSFSKSVENDQEASEEVSSLTRRPFTNHI